MNLKYEVGQTVKVEANKTVVELMESEIKSITVCSTGAKYLTSKGAFSEEQLDAFALKVQTTQPIAPQEDKAKFAVGQKVKVIGNCCCHGYSRGTILTLVRSVNFLRREPDWYVGEGTDYVSERDIEPYAEPEQPKEPIKLYCIKDYSREGRVTKGRMYTFENGGISNYDNGWKSCIEETFEDWKKYTFSISSCLIKTEKRPAKVDDIILITKCEPNKSWENSLSKVTSLNGTHGIKVDTITGKYAGKSTEMGDGVEYLVLDGYMPEPEKEPEPVYYSGEVICVSEDSMYHTQGKKYVFKNGVVNSDEERRYNPKRPVKTLSGFNDGAIPQFIPYLGE